jgi:hypothetical protein
MYNKLVIKGAVRSAFGYQFVFMEGSFHRLTEEKYLSFLSLILINVIVLLVEFSFPPHALGYQKTSRVKNPGRSFELNISSQYAVSLSPRLSIFVLPPQKDSSHHRVH